MNKLAEMGVMCGIKYSLIFTDVDGNLISFTNNDDMTFAFSKETYKLARSKKLFEFREM